MSGAHGSIGSIGTVAGRDVPAALLDARVAALRAGPMADRLPPDDCLAGRRLRRWVAQLVLTEELVRVEAGRLGVPDPVLSSEPGPGADAEATSQTDSQTDSMPPPGADPPARPDAHPVEWASRPGASLASAVLAVLPLARAVYRQVTGQIRADEAQARDYYRRNPDLWERPERRSLLHVLSAQPPDPVRLRTDGTWWECCRDELAEPLAQLAFSAAPGAIAGPVNTSFGWQVCLIGGVTPAHVVEFDTVRDQILARLTRSARDRYFERWIERRRWELVAVAAGCEHPGDPRHSDYAHHH